jgi:hypothetical protein
MIDDDRLAKVLAGRLGVGAHRPNESCWCLLEAAAWVAGEPWSDRPACVSPVLGAFGRSMSDFLPDADRQSLMPLIVPLIGTAGDGHDEGRSFLALDWLVRKFIPTWLDLAEITTVAADLRALPAVVDSVTAENAVHLVRAGERRVIHVGVPNTRGQAWVSAVNAGWPAAWGAALVAAPEAAWIAADDALSTTVAAAKVAELNGVPLMPSVVELQASAVELFRSMISPAAPASEIVQ